jgi:predicted ATPase/DNA-binding CsgD family transcriptional regulator
MDGRTIVPAGTVTLLAVDGEPAQGHPDAAAALAAARALPGARRAALHTGDAYRAGGRWAGRAAWRAEHLAEVALPGQTLVSARTAALLDGAVPLRDLGVHRLRDLSHPERVFALGAAEAGALRSLDAIPNTLPTQLTSFVGRRAERRELRGLLAGERLLTLTGTGGSGKSRLAAQAAAEEAERWPDGVWWIDLAAVQDPARVAEAVASGAGVLLEPIQGPLASLLRQLPGRRVLLCLDNCEHLLDAVAELADAVLRACPETTLLATSREPLGIPGELIWRVPGLAEDDGLLLFAERGRQAQPRFALDADAERAVRRVAGRLDGTPLALELAAAWVGTLSPREIEAGLDDRFGLLVRGPRGAAARQQTLEASVAWSHDRLAPGDQVVLRRLATFAGGFGLEAARGLCDRSDVLDALGRLVDKSLLAVEDRDGRSRYRLLETIRAYALDRLREAGEEAALRSRHLDVHLALVEGAAPLLETDKDAWRAQLELVHDDLRAALDFGLAAPDPERGRRLAAALPWLWHLHGHGQEGFDMLRRAIDRAPGERSALQGRLLLGLALVADTAAPFELEYDAAQQALELATEHGDERTRAFALALAAVGRFYTDFDAGWALNAEALASAERAGERFVLDAAPALEGIILHLRDRHDEAEPRLAAAGERLLAHGDRGVAATVLAFRSAGALATGRPVDARALAERAVAIADPLGDVHRVGSARTALALALAAAGDLDGGLAALAGIVALIGAPEEDAFVPGLARVMGTLHLWRGDAGAAIPWLEREARWTDGDAGTYLVAQALPPLAAALRRAGRADAARDAATRGLELSRALGMPEATAAALDQLGRLAPPERAPDLHQEALALRAEHGLDAGLIDGLEALGALAAARAAPGARPPGPGQEGAAARADHAARLLGAAAAARRATGLARHPVAAADWDAAVAAVAGADAAWADGEALTLRDAVAYARRGRGTRDRPPGGWEGLTPAERDVVRLVAAGATNPEVAAQLFMSRSTVKVHLSRAFGKLGVANRTELAALAARDYPAGP